MIPHKISEQVISAAKNANISIPPNPNDFDDYEEYPHFTLLAFLTMGLCVDKPEKWEQIVADDAKVIAKLTTEEIHTETILQLTERGIVI